METTRLATHFTLWRDEKPYDDYWVISDTRNGDRLLQTRNAKFAKNIHHIIQTQEGWWD